MLHSHGDSRGDQERERAEVLNGSAAAREPRTLLRLSPSVKDVRQLSAARLHPLDGGPAVFAERMMIQERAGAHPLVPRTLPTAPIRRLWPEFKYLCKRTNTMRRMHPGCSAADACIGTLVSVELSSGCQPMVTGLMSLSADGGSAASASRDWRPGCPQINRGYPSQEARGEIAHGGVVSGKAADHRR